MSRFISRRCLSLVFSGLLLALTACGEKTVAVQKPSIPEAEYGVSSSDIRATEAGMKILHDGGNAIDAAIAVQAVLGLVEPQSSGLAGGSFMMFYDPATGVTHSFDGREVAPKSATPDMFLNDDGTAMKFYDAVVSGKSIGVPGAVAMLADVHSQFGSKDWHELLAPARSLADDGFIINDHLATRIASFPRLKQASAASAAYFFNADGTPKAAGTVLKNPLYVETLDALANNPREGLYEGKIAERIIAAVNEATHADTMTLDDLQAYTPVERDPACGSYRGYKVCSMGPPSSGGVTLLQILKILENTPFADMEPNSTNAWHYYVEANRLAYADRNLYLADPDYMQSGNLGAEQIIEGMLNDAYLEDRATLIQPDKAMENVAPGDFRAFLNLDDSVKIALAPNYSPELPSTSHFTVVDADGRIVSMTTTVEFIFGSHVMASGMILNNQLTDFSFLPLEDGQPVANAVAPGKRPRSSMSPTIIYNPDGSFKAAFGSPGGPAIIPYVAKTLVGVIDWNMPLQDAIAMANIGAPRGDVLVEQDKFSTLTMQELEAMGHKIRAVPLESGVHGFVMTDNGLQGGADPRKPGLAAIAKE